MIFDKAGRMLSKFAIREIQYFRIYHSGRVVRFTYDLDEINFMKIPIVSIF